MHQHGLLPTLQGIAVWAVMMKLVFFRRRRRPKQPPPVRKPSEVNLREAKRGLRALRRVSR